MMTQSALIEDDLALLSLRVAREVDRRLNGSKSDLAVFSDFGRQLSKASGIGEHQSTFLYSDPLATEVFAQAVEQSSDQSIQDINALSNAMLKIIKPLNESADSISEDALKAVKAFCLSLHRSMMAQRLPPVSEGDSSLEDELRFI